MSTSDARWDVVGIGENSVDFVNLLPGYPQPYGPSAKMRIRERRVLCGGQMATAMCACASLGLRAKYVGVTGTDDNGRRIRAELRGRNVDVSDLVIRDVENRFAVILVDENTGDRIVLWDRDEGLRLRDQELPVDALAAARVVHVDDVDAEIAIRAARIARDGGAMVTSDIDRVTDRTPRAAPCGR
jgi:sulfofructose kinase